MRRSWCLRHLQAIVIDVLSLECWFWVQDGRHCLCWSAWMPISWVRDCARCTCLLSKRSRVVALCIHSRCVRCDGRISTKLFLLHPIARWSFHGQCCISFHHRYGLTLHFWNSGNRNIHPKCARTRIHSVIHGSYKCK